MRLATLVCKLVKPQRAMTNKVWVAVQPAASLIIVAVIAATEERLLAVEVTRLAKASSMFF